MTKLKPVSILGIGLLAFVLYGFPGLMTIDSFDQLEEARKNYYTDGHPPAMAFLWKFVDVLVAGPFGMFLIQGSSFLAGTYLILKRVMSPRRAAIAASIILMSPPVITTMIVVWKDCQMAGFLLLGIGLLFDERRWVRIAGLASLSMATAVRYNAPAATLPLVCILFVWDPSFTWLKRYAIAFGAWVAITVLAFGCNHVLTDRSVNYWYSSAAVADIVGTLRHVDRDLTDDEMKHILRGTPLLITTDIHLTMRQRYQPWNFLHLVAPGPPQIFSLPLDREPPAEHKEAMTRAWKYVITTYPSAYLQHRWWTYKVVIGWSPHVPWGSCIRHHDQHGDRLQRLGVSTRGSPLQRWLHKRMLRIVMKTKLVRPYLYLIVAFLFLPLCWKNRDAFALLVSGLVMEASLFPTALTPDLRYSHWAMTCTVIAGVILFIRRRAQAPPVVDKPA